MIIPKIHVTRVGRSVQVKVAAAPSASVRERIRNKLNAANHRAEPVMLCQETGTLQTKLRARLAIGLGGRIDKGVHLISNVARDVVVVKFKAGDHVVALVTQRFVRPNAETSIP